MSFTKTQRTQPMVASSDSQSGCNIVDDAPENGGPVERGPESGDAANQRDSDDEVYIEPIDMLVPVG